MTQQRDTIPCIPLGVPRYMHRTAPRVTAEPTLRVQHPVLGSPTCPSCSAAVWLTREQRAEQRQEGQCDCECPTCGTLFIAVPVSPVLPAAMIATLARARR